MSAVEPVVERKLVLLVEDHADAQTSARRESAERAPATRRTMSSRVEWLPEVEDADVEHTCVHRGRKAVGALGAKARATRR